MKKKRFIEWLFSLLGANIQYVERLRAYNVMLLAMHKKKEDTKLEDPESVLYKLYGFCFFASYKWFYDNLGSDKQLEVLVELYKYRPWPYEDKAYWFDRHDADRRINILKEIIKEMAGTLTSIDAAYMMIAMMLNLKIYIKNDL